MASTVPRRRYDSVELRPLSSTIDDDDDDEHKSKSDQWLNYILSKLHAILWIVIASSIAVYTNLYEIVIDGHAPGKPQRQLHR